MTINPSDGDLVILGADPPSHTHSPRVVHPQPGFIGEADALPIHDTQQAPAPGRTCATTLGSDGPSSFTATNIGARPPRLRLSPVVTTIVSVVAAVGLGSVGTLAVWLAAWAVGGASSITIASVGCVGLSGLVLIAAAVTGGRAR